MYNRSSSYDYQASKIDPLSQVIALLKPQALAWRVIEAHDAWCIRFPTTDVVVFGQLIEGGCRIVLADGAEKEFRPGDFLLMSAPSSWIMGTPGGGFPIELKAVFANPGCLLSKACQPEITRFIAGAFVFAAPNAGLLTDLMLPVVHIRGADIVADRLSILLRLLGDEALADRPGRSLVLDRLLEIILVEALRHRPTDLTDGRRGLLAGLADERIGAALRAMHTEAQRRWTVAALARHVGMSRSSFAARFLAAVGSSPIDYLLNWRMNLAKAALLSAQKPMAEIAALAGYQSVSAFSTAFSRATGCSPTAFVRAATAAPE